mmetsp:Transcript_4071/g.5666  ORF Transcript_4071/g.5666 Transcript_4071/m.5666 type:complete len:274 (+) Transcript_4071:783-1604(+)
MPASPARPPAKTKLKQANHDDVILPDSTPPDLKNAEKSQLREKIQDFSTRATLDKSTCSNSSGGHSEEKASVSWSKNFENEQVLNHCLPPYPTPRSRGSNDPQASPLVESSSCKCHVEEFHEEKATVTSLQGKQFLNQQTSSLADLSSAMEKLSQAGSRNELEIFDTSRSRESHSSYSSRGSRDLSPSNAENSAIQRGTSRSWDSSPSNAKISVIQSGRSDRSQQTVVPKRLEVFNNQTPHQKYLSARVLSDSRRKGDEVKFQHAKEILTTRY